MGLLDSLLSGSQGGYGGLLNSLLYPSPINQPQTSPQSQYDPMGNFTGVQSDGAPDPFGPPPGQAEWAKKFAPASPFTGTAPAAPVQFAAGPTQPQAPALPTPQTVAPAPQPASAPAQYASIGGQNGYQMPQFGTPSDYSPQTAQTAQSPSTDISAQSRQPDQSVQPAFLQPPTQGSFGGAFRGMAANAAAGPLGMLMGAIGGAAGMGRGNPQDIAQQNLSAQYHALRQSLEANGDSKQDAASKAMLAVMNPEAGKTILPELFTQKAELKLINDGFGGQRPAVWNPIDKTLNGKPVEEFNKSGGASNSQDVFDNISRAKAAGATPEQLYQLAPPQLRDGVQAMIEGRGIPTNLSARGDARNQAIMLAHAIDPTFNESEIPGRVKGYSDFYGGGKSSEGLRKINQSALHFGELVTDKMPNLPGTPIPAVNAVANVVNTQLLGKGTAGNFVVNAHALADELSTMFKGAGISDAEIRAWESNLSPNMSDEQQRGMAKTLLGLYRDGVTGWEKKRMESVGPVVSAQKGPLLGPEAEAALQKVDAFANNRPAKPTGGLPSGWSVKVH